ncbi:MAG TPA: ABC transporter substrate-binding protein [Candidatus Methylomirabilis sp.]|nr:ABC transporter substrate-binding protein [Candidatus Methylomirabilis sp.]
MRDQRVRASVAAVLLVLGLPVWAAAGPATEALKPEIDRVLVILSNPALKGDDKSQDRRAAIRGVTNEAFDWTEMAKRSLGRHWAGRTPAEQEEFVGLFRDLIERSYISKIEKYAGEPIQYVGDTTDGNLATVRTKIITKQAQELPIDYRMLHAGDRWLVYDVLIEGISLVNNYRTQFDGIIKTSSYDELVKKLKARTS